jgi:hypothetical protein
MKAGLASTFIPDFNSKNVAKVVQENCLIVLSLRMWGWMIG